MNKCECYIPTAPGWPQPTNTIIDGEERGGITSVARGVPELIHTSSQEPVVHFPSQFHFQQCHVGNLKSAIVGAFTPRKLASATNQGFSLTVDC